MSLYHLCLFAVSVFWCVVYTPALALDFGDDAPDFLLLDQEGYTHTLREHRGQYVLLFFYPRDFIPHSTQVAKIFEKKYPEIHKQNVVIYGISNDFVKTHANFHKQLKLTYDLLSDPDEKALKRYGATGLLGTKFISYLIGPDGRIFRKYDDNRAVNHAGLILSDLR